MNEITQYWPQLLVIALSVVALGIDAFKSGKTEIQKAPTPLAVITLGLNLALLYYGGFQFLSFANLLMWVLLSVGIAMKFKDAGKPTENNFFFKLIVTGLVHLLYYWGGFYDCF